MESRFPDGASAILDRGPRPVWKSYCCFDEPVWQPFCLLFACEPQTAARGQL